MIALFAEVGFRLLEPWPLAYVIDAVVAPPAPTWPPGSPTSGA